MPSISRIAHNWKAQISKMTANLMGSAGMEQQFDKGCFAARLLPGKGDFGQCRLSVQWSIDPPGSGSPGQITADFSAIGLCDFLLSEQARESGGGIAVVGDQHESHRFTIEPVDQAGPAAVEPLLRLSQDADVIGVAGPLAGFHQMLYRR